MAGNVSSVLNQSAQLSQILAEVNGKSVAKAIASLAKTTKGRLWNIKETALFDQSDLLTTKRGIEYLTADDKAWDRMVTVLFKPADIMDSLVSALAVQSKYEQLTAEGKTHQEAMETANRFGAEIMASRAKGSRPMAFESKNMVSQMLHMFQVEALNSWEHLSQDLPRQYRSIAAEHGKKAGARAVAAVVTKGIFSAFLLNRVAEAAYGGTPAPFDVLGWISNFVSSGKGLSTNTWLKGLVDSGWQAMFGVPLFGESGDRDEGEQENFNWSAATGDLAYNVLNDVPFLRNAAGLLGLGDQTMPLTNIAEAVGDVQKALTAEEKSAGEIGNAFLTLGGQMLPGGRQLQKTAQGIQTILSGGRTYGYGDKQRLQYPVERDPANIVQAVLFGNSGLSESRDFYASGQSGLSAKQTSLLRDMANSGSDQTEVYRTIQSIREEENTADKLQRLAQADLEDREKLKIYTGVIANSESKRPEEFRKLMEHGLSWEQVTDAYNTYMTLDESGSLNAQEKAVRFYRWVDESGMSESQKAAVKDSFTFYSMAPAEPNRYTAVTEAGLPASTAEGLATAIGKLKPESGKSSVSDIQRFRAVVDYGLTKADQFAALKSMMDETEFEKLEIAYHAGITPEQYVYFRESTDGIKADKDINGKTISGSKKQKVMEAINQMQLTAGQKTALLRAYDSGYKLVDLPWYNIIPRL